MKNATLILLLAIGIASCGENAGENYSAAEDTIHTEGAGAASPLAMKEENFTLDTFSILSNEAFNMEDKAYQLFSDLKKRTPAINVEGTNYYVVEGDIPMDTDDLMFYSQKRLVKADILNDGKSNKLTLGVYPDGTPAKWPNNYVIRYCVLKKSFINPQNYTRVVDLLKNATADWMNAANIHFEYVPEHDNMQADATAPDGLTFVVREYNTGGQFLAMAFFPGDPLYRRKVFIDPTLYHTSISQAGIIRHELGHVLGFRHEHIWNAGCTSEQIVEGHLGAIQKTPYDQYSVMHYLCKGLGTYTMELTEFDKMGAALVYGPKK